MKITLLTLVLVGVALANPVPSRNTYTVKPNTPENLALIASGNYKQNIEELSEQFEGDILLTPEQEDILSGKSRTGLIDTRYRWPDNVVYYSLSTVFDQEHADHIVLGLREMERISCLRFVERTVEPNYVEITGSNGGCYSNVGFLNNGRQTINLQIYPVEEGCFRIGTIIHEMLHTLGFYHMQSATERDDFVRIAWENIQAGTENNFNVYGADRISNFGELYDVTSVMHYSAFGFSKNGFATIIPNDITQINIMGQRLGMSDLDIARLNAMYCAA